MSKNDRIYFPRKDKKVKGGSTVFREYTPLKQLPTDEQEKLVEYQKNPEAFKGTAEDVKRDYERKIREAEVAKSQALQGKFVTEAQLSGMTLPALKDDLFEKIAGTSAPTGAGSQARIVAELRTLGVEPSGVGGRPLKKDFVKAIRKLQTQGKGLSFKKKGGSMKKERKTKMEKEVMAGEKVPEHFRKYMRLLKKEKAGTIGESGKKLLGKYKKLEGAGFFDSIAKGLKKGFEKIIDIAPKAIDIGKKVAENVPKAIELAKKVKEFTGKK